MILVCSQRRRQVLDELPTTNVLGVYLPKCTNDGKFYRPRQCRIGTDTCFCVNTYGRTIAMVYENNADDKDVCITWRNLIIKNNNSTSNNNNSISSKTTAQKQKVNCTKNQLQKMNNNTESCGKEVVDFAKHKDFMSLITKCQ